jgi:hypothetical protein
MECQPKPQDDSSEHSCPLLPACTGIERVLLLLVERFRGDDRAEPAPSPGRDGGTWDLNVLGNGHGATTNDVFAKAMVVGASCPRCVRYGGCHPRRIACTSKNLNNIECVVLANKKFRMSAYAARMSACPCGDIGVVTANGTGGAEAGHWQAVGLARVAPAFFCTRAFTSEAGPMIVLYS